MESSSPKAQQQQQSSKKNVDHGHQDLRRKKKKKRTVVSLRELSDEDKHKVANLIHQVVHAFGEIDRLCTLLETERTTHTSQMTKLRLQNHEIAAEVSRAAHLRSKLATLQYLPSGGHHAKVHAGIQGNCFAPLLPPIQEGQDLDRDGKATSRNFTGAIKDVKAGRSSSVFHATTDKNKNRACNFTKVQKLFGHLPEKEVLEDLTNESARLRQIMGERGMEGQQQSMEVPRSTSGADFWARDSLLHMKTMTHQKENWNPERVEDQGADKEKSSTEMGFEALVPGMQFLLASHVKSPRTLSNATNNLRNFQTNLIGDHHLQKEMVMEPSSLAGMFTTSCATAGYISTVDSLVTTEVAPLLPSAMVPAAAVEGGRRIMMPSKNYPYFPDSQEMAPSNQPLQPDVSPLLFNPAVTMPSQQPVLTAAASVSTPLDVTTREASKQLKALTNPGLQCGSHYHHLRPPVATIAASSSSSMMMMKMMAPEGNREVHSKLKFDPYVGAGGVFYFTTPGTNPLIKQRQSSRDDDVKLGYTIQPLEGTVRGREQSQWNDTVRSSEKRHIESSSWRNEDVNDESRRQGIMSPNWHNENAKIETHHKHRERGTCHEMHNGLYPSRQQQHNSTILAENWSDQDHNSERDYVGHGRDQCLEEAEGPRIFRHGNPDDERSTKQDYKGDREQKVGRTKERVAGLDEEDLLPSKPAALSTQSEHYYTSQQRKKYHALANKETLEENSPTWRIPEARNLCCEGCCKRAMRIERSQQEDEQVPKNWDKYASKFIYPGGATDNQGLCEPEYMMHRETSKVVGREERDDGYKNQKEDLVSEEESLLCNHRHGPVWQQWRVGGFKGAAELHTPTNCQLQRKQTSDPNQQQKERLHHVSSSKTNSSEFLRHQTYHHHLRAAGEIGQGQVEEDVGFGMCGEENLSKATSTSKVLEEQWESGTVLGSPDIETGSAACCAMSLKHSQSEHKQKLLPLRHELKNSVDHRNSDNHHEFSCNNPVNTVDNSDIDTGIKAIVDCNEQGMRRSNLGRSSIFPIVLPRFQQQQGFGPSCITFGTPIINNLEFEADNRPDCSCHNIRPPKSSENQQQKGDKLPNVKPASNCPPTAAIRSVKYARHMEVLGRHRYLYDMSLLELVNKLELEEVEEKGFWQGRNSNGIK